MSGMFDSKHDKAKRKIDRTLKEEKAKKKSRNITIIVVVAFLLLLTASLIANSSWIRRVLPVITIDGVSFSTAEYEYFFNVQYIEYMQFMSQFQGMGGPDRSRPLSTQIYDHTTGETWADLISAAVYSRLQNMVGLYNAAKEAGFSLSEEYIEKIDQEMYLIEMEALYSPDIPSANALLQRMYGTSLNTKVYRNLLEFMITAEAFSEHIRMLPEYTDSQLSDYYLQNEDDLDVFSFRLLTVNAELPDEDTPDYDIVKEQAIADAQDTARELASFIETQQDFMDVALAYNYSLYLNPSSTLRQTQGEGLNELYADWLLESSRGYGDISVFNTESGASIVFFIERDKNDYYTVGMRQILIMREAVSPANFPLGEDDPDYIEAVELAQRDAWDRAQMVDALFTSEGKTEAALLALMEEYSDDSTEGGFYDGISRFSYQGADFRAMKVVPELEEWLFEYGRQPGDSRLIETSDFGYHLMYFTGFGDKLFSHIIADDRMRTAAHNEWLDSITVGEPIKHRAFILVSV